MNAETSAADGVERLPGRAPAASAVAVTTGPLPTEPAAAGGAGALPAEDEDLGPVADLLAAVATVRSELAAAELPLDLPGTAEVRREREQLMAQLDDYLLPRLRRMDAPLLAVVGGSTGAGKSTLVNSLVQREVTRSGVLRPTTRSPVLVHHPRDSGAFLSQRILPGLGRVTSEAPEPLQPIDVHAPRVTGLRLVPNDAVPQGVAILDAPDIDSLVEANRDLAAQLLAAADLWVFVTTSARYADAVPWEMLRTAGERGVAVAVVLDRTPPDVLQEVRTHLATRLRDSGLSSAPVFCLPEQPLLDGLLPEATVAPLLGWLGRLARQNRARDIVLQRTLVGVMASLPARVARIGDSFETQVAAAERLQDDVELAFDAGQSRLAARFGDGTVLLGEVWARWQEFVATGEVFRAMVPAQPRRGRRRGATAAPPQLEPLFEALLGAVRAVTVGCLEDVQHDLLRRWTEDAAGAGLVRSGAAPERLAPDLDTRVERAVREWAHAVQLRIGSPGADGAEGAADDTGPDAGPDAGSDAGSGAVAGGELRPGTTAVAPECTAVLTDGVAVLVLVAVFSQDLPAAGPARLFAVAREVLEPLFGEERLTALLVALRSDLLARSRQLVDGERHRWESCLARTRLTRPRLRSLRAAGEAMAEAR